jgi:glycosyltransferase involved in cell wall biosynthesis
MKLLLCSSAPLDPRLGYSKTLIELHTGMTRLGWQCRLAAHDEICPDIGRYGPNRGSLEFSFALARFLRTHGSEFDVVDYDHAALPFARSGFPSSTLMVARAALLNHHFERIRIPSLGGPRAWAGMAVKGPFRYGYMKLNVWRSTRTIRTADLVNVNNDDDRTELVRRGFDPTKIVVVPLGISEAFWEGLANIGPASAAAPRIVFIGTFDERKGARDFPAIVQHIANAVPGCQFRLLGARNRTENDIREYFPRSLRPKLEIVCKFEPEALPDLLRDCSIGIFPSYIEGFGFGVLEMLAASLPVFAYDAPGPTIMLPREFLVPRGATREMASKVVALLGDRERLDAARVWARKRAHDFTLERTARATSEIYAERAQKMRAGKASSPQQAR